MHDELPDAPIRTGRFDREAVDVHARAEAVRERLTGRASPLALATRELATADVDPGRRRRAQETIAHTERLLNIVDGLDHTDGGHPLAPPRPHTSAARVIGPVVGPPRWQRTLRLDPMLLTAMVASACIAVAVVMFM